jgi:GxxExxY protein
LIHAEARRGRRKPDRGTAVRELDEITDAIIDEAIRIHRDLGPGLLESGYEAVLARALEKRGFHVERQVPIRLEYDGMAFEEAFRVDMIVEGHVVVELKSVERLPPVTGKKLLTYLRIANKRVRLLLNFGAYTLREGIRRVVNDLPPSASPRLRVNRAVP